MKGHLTHGLRTKGPMCLLTLLLVGGCSGSSSDPEDIIEYEAFAHTVLLDQASLAAISAASSDLAEITFDGGPEQLAQLIRGKVIVGGVGPHSPRGILRTVESVAAAGEGMVVTTRPASLVHAFRRLRIEVRREHANPNDDPIEVIKQSLRESASADGLGRSAAPLTVSGGHTFGGNIDWIVFDGDRDSSTTDDRIQVSGELTAKLGFTFKLSFDLGKIDIDPFEFPPDIDVAAIDLQISLDTKIEAAADLDLAGAAALSYEKEVLLGSIPLGTIMVGPVALVPVLSARAGIEGGASSTFQVGFSETASFGAGLAFSGSDGLTHSIQTPTADFELSETAVHLGASAKAWVRPELAMLAYGFIGPTAGVELYARAEADVDADPCYAFYGGLDARVGIALELLSTRVVDEAISVPLAEKQIAQGACTLPPKVTDIEPKFTPSSTYLPDTLSSSGSITDWTDLELTTDGRFVVATTESERLVKVDPDGKLVWSRSYTDKEGPFDELLHPQSVAPAHDGGLLVGARPHALLKLASDGQLEWAARPKPAGEVKSGFSAIVRADDGALVAGTIIETLLGPPDLWLIKLDKAGQVSWSVTWGQPDIAEKPLALLALNDGYLVVGELFSTTLDPAKRGFVLRLDAKGKTRWARELVGCSTVESLTLRTVTLSQDGDYVVGGNYASPTRTLLAEVRPDGTLSWSAAYRGTDVGIGLDLTSVQQLDSGGFITAGTYVTAGNSDDLWLAAVDSIGRIDWARRYVGPVDDQAPALVLTPDNGVVMAAPTGSFGENPGADAGLWLLKVPRKDGRISFASGANVEVLDLAHEAVTPCLTSEVSSLKTTPVDISLEVMSLETAEHASEYTSLAP